MRIILTPRCKGGNATIRLQRLPDGRDGARETTIGDMLYDSIEIFLDDLKAKLAGMNIEKEGRPK